MEAKVGEAAAVINMKKVLIGIGLYCGLLHNSAIAQIKIGAVTGKSDTTAFGFRTLQIDEINLVSSYYQQDGNNSAVTGGIGTEYLTNIGNSLDLKLSFTDKKRRLNSISIDGNVDYYSSASSDNIDPNTISSASKTDRHIYPSISWSQKNEKKHQSRGINVSYSTEWDYTSYGASLNYTKFLNNDNTEITLKASTFLDTWDVILPVELRTTRGNVTKPRNSYSASIGVSHVVNQRLQFMFMTEPTYQEGLLSTPFHRVYFSNNSMKVEKLPGVRIKLPVSLRTNYFLGDNIVLRSYYRFYADDWGMIAHTASLETTYKINSFFSVTPHFRYNKQSAVKYFSAYKTHKISDEFYTSDYDISGFQSYYYGAGVRIAPPGGILGVRFWSALEVRYGHYSRSTNMVANSISISTKIK